jgi:hypothetical protein
MAADPEMSTAAPAPVTSYPLVARRGRHGNHLVAKSRRRHRNPNARHDAKLGPDFG